MLPIADINPTRRVPFITYALIAINFLVFFWELTLGDRALQQAFIDLSVVPANVSRLGWLNPETLMDVVRSMFFHGGWAHILGNMLYLWIFGDNIEDRFGIVLYLALYFASGFAAAFAQIMIDPQSQVPLVGASGAIAGVLGAYAVLFPNVRVRGLIALGRVSTLQEMPALLVLGFWFVIQLVSGFGSAHRYLSGWRRGLLRPHRRLRHRRHHRLRPQHDRPSAALRPARADGL
ncbi:MAG: rhomboid family intramembrane serine protease [Anaerolineae bacterium]